MQEFCVIGSSKALVRRKPSSIWEVFKNQTRHRDVLLSAAKRSYGVRLCKSRTIGEKAEALRKEVVNKTDWLGCRVRSDIVFWERECLKHWLIASITMEGLSYTGQARALCIASHERGGFLAPGVPTRCNIGIQAVTVLGDQDPRFRKKQFLLTHRQRGGKKG